MVWAPSKDERGNANKVCVANKSVGKEKEKTTEDMVHGSGRSTERNKRK